MKRMMSLAAALMVSAPAMAAAPTPTPDYPNLQAFADSVVRVGLVPGIAIAIGVGNEPTRYITAGKISYDVDAPTVTPDSLWRMYSMTKPVTGMAAMILVERGKLRLDQPISEIFPEYGTMRVLVDPAKGLETRPAASQITIRQLLTHTAGLDYGIGTDTPAHQKLADDGIVAGQTNAALEAMVRPTRPKSLAAFASAVAREPLMAEPGTVWSYSMSLDVLAAVVEKVSGMPFEDFVAQEILKPLKMNDTVWQVPADKAGRLASSYASAQTAPAAYKGTARIVTANYALVDGGRDSAWLQKPSFPYGGAGLVSSARDYERFMHMLDNGGVLDGARVMKAETSALARSNLLPAGIIVHGNGAIPPGQTAGYGAGGYVTVADKDIFGRGRGTYGWDGAAGTRAWVDPVRHVHAVMMVNLFGAAVVQNGFNEAVERDMAARQTKR